MIKALRRLSYLAVALFAVWLAASYYVMRAPVPELAPLAGQIDRIVIEKTARQMTLFKDGEAVRTYSVALGFEPDGDKVRQGDGKTPEGIYKIDRRNSQSAFHLSLGINYPLPEDRARAAAGGYNPGGDIFIHGQPNAMPDLTVLRGDWTAGCIAVSNAEMREIFKATPIGTVVEIRG